MLAQLGPECPRVLEGSHYWLAGTLQAKGERGTAVATVGFVAFDSCSEQERQLPALCAGTLCPEGQYALARIDDEGGLTLTRSVSGGERLYYTQVDGSVLFSSSIRPLLAHPKVKRVVDIDVLRQRLLSGHAIFGQQTGVLGIDEVQPGHDACFALGVAARQRWTRDDFLHSPEGDVEQLARAFRDRLRRAVELAIGEERPVAIALSGGIDSSAIAAAAVDVVETSQIRAYSWEFDDPTHPKETHYARMVSRRLGIANHDVLSIDAPAFLKAIPEHLWRSECAMHWPKAFLLTAARDLMARGHGRYLTGFGIGSHMGYLHDLTRILRWLPKSKWLGRAWKQARFGRARWPHWLDFLHPGLEAPHPRLYAMLAEALCHEGLFDDHRELFPVELHALLPRRPRPTDGGGLTLTERLQRQSFSHLVSCIDVTRSEKSSREIGIHRIAPAHFTSCLPYAYFPVAPSPRAWTSDRQRPGKLLLKHAYRGILPDEVLFRVKSWADAVVSPNWRRRARVHMLRALPRYPHDLAKYGRALPDVVEYWEPRSIQANCLSQRLWLELFIEREPEPSPPSWAELWNLPDDGAITHGALTAMTVP